MLKFGVSRENESGRIFPVYLYDIEDEGSRSVAVTKDGAVKLNKFGVTVSTLDGKSATMPIAKGTVQKVKLPDGSELKINRYS